MKFKADRNKLSEAVGNASKACATKTAFNSLDGVLLSLNGNKLTVTGYDLEMGIKVMIMVDGEIDGEIVVDARLFGDMIKRMPNDNPVEIEVKDEKDVTVRSGKIKLEIQGTSGNNFPNILDLNDDISFGIKENILRNMLSQVSHAIAQTDINPALMGAKFNICDNMLSVVTSDGVRLALREEKVTYNDLAFIVPEKTVMELCRNLSESEIENDVKITVDRNQICFSKDSYIIFSRLLEGKFIDYNRIIDFKPERTATVNVREMISSLERTLLLITERFKSPVVCSFNGEGEDAVMHISCKTNLGTIDEDLSVKYDTNYSDNDKEKDFTIAYNPKFMLDALKNSGCDEVKIMFLTDLSPIKIVPVSEDGFLFVVVPVRLK